MFILLVNFCFILVVFTPVNFIFRISPIFLRAILCPRFPKTLHRLLKTEIPRLNWTKESLVKLKNPLVRHLVFVPDLKTNCSIFSCLFCNLTDVFFHYLKSAESKNFLLNLLHPCLSVNLSDDLFSPFSPLTICLRHIPESQKEPKL